MMNNNQEKFIGKKIMLVDDDTLNLKIADRFVKTYGVNTDLSERGKELISKIEAGEKCDLIITDEMMPEMSGTEAMKYLKSKPNFNIPIVVLTGNTVDGAKEKFLKEGFDYYLEKPINKEELNNVMNRFINY